jgi:hypothetical protein
MGSCRRRRSLAEVVDRQEAESPTSDERRGEVNAGEKHSIKKCTVNPGRATTFSS